jgi:CRISP-associated protein Cas1
MEMISDSQLNTWLFCPRLLYLEAVLGCKGSNVESEEGRWLHDKLASEEVYLESADLGLCGKLDVYRSERIPIEYKRGKPMPDGMPWQGHKVQLCAMALLLETVEQRPVPMGYIWYYGTRQRLDVDVQNDTLRDETRHAMAQVKALLGSSRLPPPLTNRKACLGCNQYRNCLPDELTGTTAPVESRTIIAPHVEGQPLYIDKAGCKLAVKEGSLVISHFDTPDKQTVGLNRLNQIVIQQAVHCSSSFLQACTERDIPVCFLDYAGKWKGSLTGQTTRNVQIRLSQYEQCQNASIQLRLSQTLVSAKLTNQRVWLRRHLGKDNDQTVALTRALKSVPSAQSTQQLMGIEGEAARQFYEGFNLMLGDNALLVWMGRHKHPSPDPINSLLSFGYSMLMQQALTGCQLTGLDPYLGFYHSLKHGKPALALDLMEIYRTPVVDSVVMGFIKRGQCGPDDFDVEGSRCVMKEPVRKAFVKAFFERLREPVKHPVFGYECTYQRAIHVEARLLSYALLSGLELWRPFQWR